MTSPKTRFAAMATTIGCRAPITVALAMVVSFTAEKNSATSKPSAMPPAIEARITFQPMRWRRADMRAATTSP